MTKFFVDREYQVFRILQAIFVVAPILAGLDKFFFLLTNWSKYLSPFAIQMLQGHSKGFLMGVGAIEIIVGIGVLFRPKLFAYIICVWLLCIIFNLIALGHNYDIVLRDLALTLTAFCLARLSPRK